MAEGERTDESLVRGAFDALYMSLAETQRIDPHGDAQEAFAALYQRHAQGKGSTLTGGGQTHIVAPIPLGGVDCDEEVEPLVLDEDEEQSALQEAPLTVGGWFTNPRQCAYEVTDDETGSDDLPRL